MYKYETHLHTKNCSACGKSDAKEYIESALKNGYSGFVITNHFFKGNTCIDKSLPWKDFVGAYAEDYYEAERQGKKYGIQVFFGLEEGYGNGKEILIYGISPEIMAAHPEFAGFNLQEQSDFIHKNGGLCFFAHPFRQRDYITDPDALPDLECADGIEGYNYLNSSEENEKAFLLAINSNKTVISGGDVHIAENFGHSGVAFDRPVKDYADFLKKLKSGNFKLLNKYI